MDFSPVYKGNTSATPDKNRKRKIIWFNPPYRANVTSKIGNKFLQILDKHFQNHTNFISFLTATTLKLAIIPYQILPA